MKKIPACLFLDTNVFIIGFADSNSAEFKILQWAGIGQKKAAEVEIVVSAELLEQISRVAKRLENKDWSGQILGRIWRDLSLRYVVLDTTEFFKVEVAGSIPREDISVYLTAKTGKAECFISSNHELLRSIVKKTGEFECLTPKQFVEKYFN
jgi:predicted nucleic acid-binding protein